MAKPHMLILVQLADHLGAAELRCLLHELVRPVQRIGQHHLHRKGRMSASELFKQRKCHLLLGRVRWILGWFRGTVFRGNAPLLVLFVLFVPGRQGWIWHVKRAADRNGDHRGDQHQQDKVLPIDIPTTGLVVERMGCEDARGHFTAFLVRVIDHKRALRDPVFRKITVTLICSKHPQGILALRKIQDKAASEYVPRPARSNLAQQTELVTTMPVRQHASQRRCSLDSPRPG